MTSLLLLKQGPDGIDEESSLYADAVRNISWDENSVFILALLINLSRCGLNNIQLILESAEERYLVMDISVVGFIWVHLYTAYPAGYKYTQNLI